MTDELWAADEIPMPETVAPKEPTIVPVNPGAVPVFHPASMYPTLRFKVPGVPAPQGSKRGFVRGKRVVMVEDSKRVAPFRTSVAEFAHQQMMGQPLLEGPLRLSCLFQWPRPDSHFTTKRALRKGAPAAPGHQHGDLDKLVRAVCDAMTGIVYRDDAQVTSYMPPFGKRWGLEAATYIIIEPDPLDY